MPRWFDLDWSRIFVPSQPVLETVLRGTCMYLALFALLRLFRRQTGSLGPADLLVLLLIADAAQNGMAADYRSVTDGILLVATIIGWEYVLDWLAFRVPRLRPWLERSPLVLVKDGQVNQESLRAELMTVEELMAQLRQKGVDDPSLVRISLLEGDGHVSVVTSQPTGVQSSDERRAL